MPGGQLAHTSREPALAHLTKLKSEAAQDDRRRRSSDAELHVVELALQQLAPDQERPDLLCRGDLQCTGRNQPMRSSWAMPRASLRSCVDGPQLARRE